MHHPPDTLFGATYMVLSPSTRWSTSWPGRSAEAPGGAEPRWTAARALLAVEAVQEYRRQAAHKSDLERQENKDKTGVFTALRRQPRQRRADPGVRGRLRLMGYGTGAIMAVPAHDARDHEFATAFGLPICRSSRPPTARIDVQAEAYAGDGVA